MDKRKIIEWHPAFEASIQIEFENEIEKMTFEPEHLLSKQPMRIDELVIKIRGEEKIQHILFAVCETLVNAGAFSQDNDYK